MSLRVSIIGSNSSASVVPGWNDYEIQQIERNFLGEGVIQDIGGALAVSERGAGANMSVDIASGRALIEITNTNLAHGKTYKVYFDRDATENRAVATADTTNPRKDRVILRVSVAANPDGSSGNVGTIEVLTGTPAGSPSPPAEPANAITLALIDVPASDTSIENAQITDQRPFVTVNAAVLLDLARKASVDSDVDALRKDSPTWLGTITGTDTLTGTLPYSAGAYAAGMRFAFMVANTNTGAVTINLSSLGAKDIKAPDGSALAAGMLKQNGITEIRYDGTKFLLTSMAHNAVQPNVIPIAHSIADSSTINSSSYSTFDVSASILANTLQQKDVIHIYAKVRAAGDVVGDVKIRFGGTDLVERVNTSFNGNPAHIHVEITVRSTGASGSLEWGGHILGNNAAVAANGGNLTKDTTGSLAIELLGAKDSGSGSGLILSMLNVYVRRGP